MGENNIIAHMRLDNAQTSGLQHAVRTLPAGARVFLFGSRTHDQKKGWDIDILILVDKPQLINDTSLNFLRAYQQVQDDHLDVLVHTPEQMQQSPFLRIIQSELVPLDTLLRTD